MDLQGEIDDDFTSIVIEGAQITERLEIRTINGMHAGKLNNVKCLFFEDSTVHYIPSGLFKWFPQLYELNVIYCGLKEISPDDLFGLHNLEYLWLLGNDLKSLPDDLFVHTKNLRAMTVRGNKLERVSWHLFDVLTVGNISLMDFQDNPNIDVKYNIYDGLAGLARLEAAMELCVGPIEHPILNLSEITANTFNLVIRNGPILRNYWKCDDTNGIAIKKRNEEDVEKLLQSMYTGRKENSGNALELFNLTFTSDVQYNKAACEDAAVKHLTEHYAFAALAVGNLHKSNKIVGAAFDKINQMLPDKLDEELKVESEVIEEILKKFLSYKKTLQERKPKP